MWYVLLLQSHRRFLDAFGVKKFSRVGQAYRDDKYHADTDFNLNGLPAGGNYLALEKVRKTQV